MRSSDSILLFVVNFRVPISCFTSYHCSQTYLEIDSLASATSCWWIEGEVQHRPFEGRTEWPKNTIVIES